MTRCVARTSRSRSVLPSSSIRKGRVCMAEPALWKSTSAWTGLAVATHAPGRIGVVASPLEGLGIASVHVRRGGSAALAERVKALFDLDLPDGPRRVEAGPVAFVATGP